MIVFECRWDHVWCEVRFLLAEPILDELFSNKESGLLILTQREIPLLHTDTQNNSLTVHYVACRVSGFFSWLGRDFLDQSSDSLTPWTIHHFLRFLFLPMFRDWKDTAVVVVVVAVESLFLGRNKRAWRQKGLTSTGRPESCYFNAEFCLRTPGKLRNGEASSSFCHCHRSIFVCVRFCFLFFFLSYIKP